MKTHSIFTPDVADFAPGLLAITSSPMPRLPRAIFYTVVALFAILLAWALLAKVDIVASAEGRLVPSSYTKIVQPAEAGVVTELLVKEGDAVQAGQVLIRLDPTVAGADSSCLRSDTAYKRLSLRRIDSALAGQSLPSAAGDEPAMLAQVQAQARAHAQAYADALAQEQAALLRAANELAAAQETLAKLKATLPSYQQSAAAHARLVAEGFVSPIAGNDKEREAIEKAQDLKSQAATVKSLEATISGQKQKIAVLTSNYRSGLLIERTEAMAQVAKLEQEGNKLGYKTRLLELRAPQAGIVKDIATTTNGTVVQPGMVLLTLVPKGERLLAEVQVRNEDVGNVRTGQSVRIKVAAFPFQKYGLIEGKVQVLAADSQTPNSAAPSVSAAANTGYKAWIALDTQTLPPQGGSDGSSAGGGAAQRGYPLEPGMQVVAEIHQGRRTIMEYLLSPVQKVAAEAARER